MEPNFDKKTEKQRIRETLFDIEEVNKKLAESTRQAREELKQATDAAEKLMGTKIPETSGKKENVPKSPEVVEAEKEIAKLSPEEKEKIAFGLNTFGFWAEKKKDDYFASVFDESLEKTDKNGKIIQKGFNQKGTTGRFCAELRDYFIRNSKDAEKKANDASAFSDVKLGVSIKGEKRGINISAGKQKAILNLGAFSGNVLKYGRLIYDATGVTIGAANRIAMAAGMATTVLAEAGKEARLKNEDVIEKTRIQDTDLAANEAWEIYQDAQKNQNFKNEKTEAFKKAYMLAMPKDLLKRLENPSTANNFIQRTLRRELLGYEKNGHIIFEGAISRLNKEIEKLESDNNITEEKKKLEIEKLITKQKKNLEDYDRIITQYGTIDGIAMALRYAQTAGKATVAALQVETLLITADKICEGLSNIYHHFHDAQKVFTFKVSDPKAFSDPLPKPEPAPSASVTPETATAPGAPSAIKNFANEGIKFEHGKGGIQGILDLKKQILAQYNGNYSNAPKSIQDFMDTDATKQAIKLGLYNPDNPEESALIREGSVLKFDAQGNLIFHDAKTGKDVAHYAGKMFDSGGSAKISTTDHAKFIENNEETETPATESPQKPEPERTPATNDLEKQTHERAEKARQDLLDMYEKTETKTDIETNLNKPGLGYQKVSMGRNFETGTKVHTGSLLKTGSSLETGSRVGTGSWVGVGSGGYYGGQQYYGPLTMDSLGRYHDITGKIVFPDISPDNNAILQDHPEYAYNPSGLTGTKLIEAYGTGYKNMKYLFGENPLVWQKLGALKAGKLMEQAGRINDASAESSFAHYLNLLKEFSDLPPKTGVFNSETSEYYMARALQKITADGLLGELKKSMEQYKPNK
jgi:hypothetical protein